MKNFEKQEGQSYSSIDKTEIDENEEGADYFATDFLNDTCPKKILAPATSTPTTEYFPRFMCGSNCEECSWYNCRMVLSLYETKAEWEHEKAACGNRVELAVEESAQVNRRWESISIANKAIAENQNIIKQIVQSKQRGQ